MYKRQALNYTVRDELLECDVHRYRHSVPKRLLKSGLMEAWNIFLRSLHAAHPTIAKVLVEIPPKKTDFAHRSDVVVQLGSRELRAVKIPASYNAWRPPKRRKNDSERIQFFFVSEISFSSCCPGVKRARQFQTSKSASS